MMTKATLNKIENFREVNKIKGVYWTDWRNAPCGWETMQKYPEVFETKIEIIENEDDGEEWVETLKLWKFKE